MVQDVWFSWVIIITLYTPLRNCSLGLPTPGGPVCSHGAGGPRWGSSLAANAAGSTRCAAYGLFTPGAGEAADCDRESGRHRWLQKMGERPGGQAARPGGQSLEIDVRYEWI